MSTSPLHDRINGLHYKWRHDIILWVCYSRLHDNNHRLCCRWYHCRLYRSCDIHHERLSNTCRYLEFLINQTRVLHMHYNTSCFFLTAIFWRIKREPKFVTDMLIIFAKSSHKYRIIVKYNINNKQNYMSNYGLNLIEKIMIRDDCRLKKVTCLTNLMY